MGRRHIYYCDNCRADFKNDIHINIKSIRFCISYPVKINKQDPSKSEWASRDIGCDGEEKHFCNGKCAGEYVDKKVANLLEKLHIAVQLIDKEKKDEQPL